MKRSLAVLGLCGLVMSVGVVVAAEVVDSIKQQAEQGDSRAQARLAAMYLLGRDGVEKDDKQAAVWMEKAANQGLIEAQVVMGAMYDRGLGMEANRDRATQWYEKAAAKGHGTSLAILGRNDAAQGSVQFNYQAMRLNAAKSIPGEYAKKFLISK